MKPAALLAAALLALFSTAAVGREEVRILVPQFSGEEPKLGRTTSNLLRLQVSQTFREADTDTRAVMVLLEKQLPTPSHLSAQDAGMTLGSLSHIVLWGQAYHYPDGIVVETHLSLTPWLFDRDSRPELWEVKIPGLVLPVRSELPREVYELPSVTLGLEAAQHFSDFDGLTIYADRAFTRPIGRFRDTFRALRYESDAVYLTSGGKTGYVPLPHLYDERNETVDFVAGYIRILRGDWHGAAQLFRNVLERPDLTRDVAMDSRIFLGLTEEKRGRSGLHHFKEAAALNPYDRAAAAYVLQGLLAEATRRTGPGRAAMLATLDERMEVARPLFPENGEWLPLLRQASRLLTVH